MFCASLRRGCKATTLRLFPPSHHGAISLSMLLGVTIVEVGWVFSTEHHSLSTTRNFGQRHRLNALIYNYAATQFRPHYGCLSSTGPPSSSPNSQPFATFLTEFRHLVECVGTKSGTIILGDFNVPHGDVDDAHARAVHILINIINSLLSLMKLVNGDGLSALTTPTSHLTYSQFIKQNQQASFKQRFQHTCTCNSSIHREK